MIKIFIAFTVIISLICYKLKNESLTGKWRLIRYHNVIAGTSESQPANIPRSIIIEFSDNGYKGKINGLTVTNEVFGEYELIKGKKMKILNFGGTKVGEPTWGNKFWNSIHTASSYYRHKNKLFLFFNAGIEKMEFKKE